MPELAEVEYYRRQWAASAGQRVEQVELNAGKRVFRGLDTDALSFALTGQRMTHSAAHGKQMYFVFGPVYWLGVHLGMTGKLVVADSGYERNKHDHLLLRMSGGQALVFTDPRMFGRILYEVVAGPAGLPAWLRGLPPEVLSEAFTPAHMNAFLDRRARAPIKAVLLMQEAFPGVGNWMADEILWRARIRPATQAGAIGLEKRIELFDTLKAVCADAMRVIAPDWGSPPDDWLFNHRWKDGGLCPQTGKPLRREKLAGRTTCWSPAWQVDPGART